MGRLLYIKICGIQLKQGLHGNLQHQIHIRIEDISQIMNLSFHLKQLLKIKQPNQEEKKSGKK